MRKRKEVEEEVPRGDPPSQRCERANRGTVRRPTGITIIEGDRSKKRKKEDEEKETNPSICKAKGPQPRKEEER